MYSATENKTPKFKQLREKDHSPIRYKRVAETDGEEVEYELVEGDSIVLLVADAIEGTFTDVVLACDVDSCWIEYRAGAVVLHVGEVVPPAPEEPASVDDVLLLLEAEGGVDVEALGVLLGLVG